MKKSFIHVLHVNEKQNEYTSGEKRGSSQVLDEKMQAILTGKNGRDLEKITQDMLVRKICQTCCLEKTVLLRSRNII